MLEFLGGMAIRLFWDVLLTSLGVAALWIATGGRATFNLANNGSPQRQQRYRLLFSTAAARAAGMAVIALAVVAGWAAWG